MTLDKRIQADIEGGDLGSARRRLAAHLATCGYDADKLARLGRICFEMRDLHEAGRMWLCSSATGVEVTAAIKAFVRRCGRNPQQIWRELPSFARRHPRDAYPPLVRERLAALELSEDAAKEEHERPHRPVTLRQRMAAIAAVAFVIFLLVSLVVGALTILFWIFGRLS